MGFCVFLSKFFSFPLLDTNTFYRKCFINCIRKGEVTIIQLVEKKWGLLWGFLLQTPGFSLCLTYNVFSASEITPQTTRYDTLTICL